jgi:hypothetical protein
MVNSLTSEFFLSLLGVNSRYYSLPLYFFPQGVISSLGSFQRIISLSRVGWGCGDSGSQSLLLARHEQECPISRGPRARSSLHIYVYWGILSSGSQLYSLLQCLLRQSLTNTRARAFLTPGALLDSILHRTPALTLLRQCPLEPVSSPSRTHSQ